MPSPCESFSFLRNRRVPWCNQATNGKLRTHHSQQNGVRQVGRLSMVSGVVQWAENSWRKGERHGGSWGSKGTERLSHGGFIARQRPPAPHLRPVSACHRIHRAALDRSYRLCPAGRPPPLQRAACENPQYL